MDVHFDPIITVEPIVLKIPFDDGGKGLGITPNRWNALDIVLLRVETQSGLIGWGEGFGYVCQHVTARAIKDMIAPFAIGRNSCDPVAVNQAAQLTFHLFGRYGVTMFAISALDIALWDIKAKRQKCSLGCLLGGRVRDSVRAYASLVRYGDADLVHHFCTQAIEQGYQAIKLHEIEEAPITAARNAAPHAEITVDANCQIDVQRALDMVPYLKKNRIEWLEEPVFPPENSEAWAQLRAQGINIAAGENFCTLEGFIPFLPFLNYVQPSVTKIGGITEFLRVAEAVRSSGKKLAAHSPYFGPGYWASLQLASAIESFDLFEYLYVKPEASCGLHIPLPQKGTISIPDNPGIGFEPDFTIIEKYRVNS